MKKILLICVVLFSLLFNTACPEKAKKTFRKASEASAKLSIYGEKLIQANIDAFKAKEISPETFNKLNSLTGKFVDGMKIYEKALDDAELVIKTSGEIPAGTLEKLSLIFNEHVVDSFLEILTEFKVVGNENSEVIKTLLAGIRLAILTIQESFTDAREFQNQGDSNYGMV